MWVVLGVIILVQAIVNIVLYRKIKGERSIIYYGDYLLTLGLTDELRSVTYVGSVIS